MITPPRATRDVWAVQRALILTVTVCVTDNVSVNSGLAQWGTKVMQSEFEHLVAIDKHNNSISKHQLGKSVTQYTTV